MANDDNTLGAVLTLAVGGAAGYAAGRWLVEPWLASRASHPATGARRQALTGEPIDPYAAPGEMKPIDPYVISSSPSVAIPPIDGPITSPSQVDRTLAQPSTATALTAPSQPAPPPSSSGKFATSAGVRRFDAVFD